jgi:hypoxanthine phosphoribosyltransferase
MAWNAKSIKQRQAEFDALIVAANGGTEAGGELAEFYKRGLSVRVPELLLSIWPAS